MRKISMKKTAKKKPASQRKKVKEDIVFNVSEEELRRITSSSEKTIPSEIKLVIPEPKFEDNSDLIKLSLRLFIESFWFITKVTLLFFIPFKLIQYSFYFKTIAPNDFFPNIKHSSNI